jgi:rare lipoprotein A
MVCEELLGNAGGGIWRWQLKARSGFMGSERAETGRRLGRAFAVAGTCLLLANCSSKLASRVDPKYGVSSSPRVVGFGEAVPKGGGTYRVGKPYTVAGRTYVPEENIHYRAEGLASWYGDSFHGRLTANGEVFDMTSLTAAHPTLPMPSYVRVTNLQNGKSLVVRVNDRGPYHGNRIIDLSNTAARLLEFRNNGVARVRVEYVGRAPLEGSDDRVLMATLRSGEPAPAPSTVRIASAAPFVPEIRSSHSALRGDIPVPSERPYSLGATAGDMAAVNATEVSARTRRGSDGSQVASADEDSGTAPATRPVAAYAPVRHGDGNNFLGGRGLY